MPVFITHTGFFMADQTQRLEAATVKAEVGSGILYRFANDPVTGDPIPTLSGDIPNLKVVIQQIQDEGAEKISFATRIYATTAAGIAATVNGEIFLVVSNSATEIYAVYKNNAGVAQDTGKRALSSQAVQDATNAALAAAEDAQDSADTAISRTARFLLPAATLPNVRDDGTPLQIGDRILLTSGNQNEYIYKSTGWVINDPDLNNALLIGDYGVGGNGILATSNNIDLITKSGFYRINSSTVLTTAGLEGTIVTGTVVHTQIDTNNATQFIEYVSDTGSGIQMQRYAIRSLVGGTWKSGNLPLGLTGQLVMRRPTSITSAATTNLAAATSNLITLSGGATITSFGTPQEGSVFFVRFQGGETLVYNATTMFLPGSANILTRGGDTAILQSLGGGAMKMLHYQRADGTPLIPSKVDEYLAIIQATALSF